MRTCLSVIRYGGSTSPATVLSLALNLGNVVGPAERTFSGKAIAISS